jgi:hypothetical protein
MPITDGIQAQLKYLTCLQALHYFGVRRLQCGLNLEAIAWL